MKRFCVAAALAAVAGLTGSVLADGRVNVNNAANGNYNGGNGGGGFEATWLSGYVGAFGGNGASSATSFITFCIEEGETFSPGSDYYVRIASEAVSGQNAPGSGWDPSTNTDAPAGSDPLSSATALLYRTFRDGGDFGGLITGAADNPTEVGAVQQAIWFSEGEVFPHDLAGFQTNQPLAYALWNWANTNNDGSLYQVRVLQLWENADFTGNHQDMLTIVPLAPAGWAGLSALAGVAGFGAIRRRNLRAN